MPKSCNWTRSQWIEYRQKWRREHPGYNAAKMAAYRKGRDAKWITASDYKRIPRGKLYDPGTVQRPGAEDRQAPLEG